MNKITKILFLSVLTVLLSYSNVKSQDTVRISHTNYTTVFSKSKKYPVLVEWWATKAKISCASPLKRKDNFKPDPKLPKETDLIDDYKNSGFDRGHMMPAADNLCQTQGVQDECFYFSNMSAQYHSLNAGDWKSVETWTREMALKYDSVHVWCGNIGEVSKIGRVSVPKECWKVVYIKKTNEFFAFMFDNKNIKQTGIKSHEVAVESISKTTGFKFR
jgi:endonuclease G